MKIKNETEIQLMKILFKSNGSKTTKNITSSRAYPYGIEQKLFRQLKGFYKPLTDYVNKFISENTEELLRGDSKDIHLDEIPGNTFDKMIYELEDWLSIYMPDISSQPKDSSNAILISLGKTAEEAKEFGDKEFQKTIEKGIHVSPPVASEWWDDMKTSWAENNYTLIVSNAKNYVSKINTLTEQAIVNGWTGKKLKEEIKNATQGLSDKHCKLLARDQMGKLNGQIAQGQMQELGLEMYVWSTSADDRVRDSHAVMEGLLCRYDDASVCSYDSGKTWVKRPSGAVELHPGQDIQCRCVALAFYPELTAEVKNTSLSEQTEGLPDVQDLLQFEDVDNAKNILKNIADDSEKNLTRELTNELLNDSNEIFNSIMTKLTSDKTNLVIVDDSFDISGYSKKVKKINLKPNISSSIYRHEVFHYLDDVLGKNGQVVFNSNLVEKYRWNFSKSEEFEKIYLKELNDFVNNTKKEIKLKYNLKTITIDSLDSYLEELNINEREKLIVKDMFTAKEKSNFGGHPKDYFIDIERVRNSKMFENEKILGEGFSELSESIYGKNISKKFKELLNSNFSETIPIINKRIDEYLGG